MNGKIEQLTNHIQERCLWQFFSRTWDREENIEGILSYTIEILGGETSEPITYLEKSHFADAKVLASDFKRLFPWITKMEKDEIKDLLEGVKARLTTIVVTESHNEELKDPNY